MRGDEAHNRRGRTNLTRQDSDDSDVFIGEQIAQVQHADIEFSAGEPLLHGAAARRNLALRGNLIADTKFGNRLHGAFARTPKIGIDVSDRPRSEEGLFNCGGRGDIGLQCTLGHGDSHEETCNRGGTARDNVPGGQRSGKRRHDKRHVQRLTFRD